MIQLDAILPCAKWTNDCQGKKDYDGRLISISTRYWPGVGGLHVLPSASAKITLNHGEPDEYGYGNYVDLVDREFTADTEQEVRQLVEAWVTEKTREIAKLLAEHFKTTTAR